MSRKLGLALLVGLFAVGVVSAGGTSGVVAFVIGWFLLGYLLWRAWPAVRRDLATLSGLLPSVGFSRARGEHL